MSQCWPVAKMWHRPYRELFFGSQTSWRRSANAHWLYLGCLGITISCCSLLISQRTRKERMYHFCIELSKAAAHLLSGVVCSVQHLLLPFSLLAFLIVLYLLQNWNIKEEKREKEKFTHLLSVHFHAPSYNNLNNNEAIQSLLTGLVLPHWMRHNINKFY